MCRRVKYARNVKLHVILFHYSLAKWNLAKTKSVVSIWWLQKQTFTGNINFHLITNRKQLKNADIKSVLTGAVGDLL